MNENFELPTADCSKQIRLEYAWKVISDICCISRFDTAIPTPFRSSPPARKMRHPDGVTMQSWSSTLHVSHNKHTSKSHISNSATKSWKRHSSRILCKFLVKTCKRINSVWWLASLVVCRYGAAPFLVTNCRPTEPINTGFFNLFSLPNTMLFFRLHCFKWIFHASQHEVCKQFI